VADAPAIELPSIIFKNPENYKQLTPVWVKPTTVVSLFVSMMLLILFVYWKLSRSKRRTAIEEGLLVKKREKGKREKWFNLKDEVKSVVAKEGVIFDWLVYQPVFGCYIY